MELLFSVIVPVYNKEKYLSKSIESLVDQTYRNLEIILIDDGSTDCSGQVCDKYASADKRIKVLHQENAGTSKARNEGIKAAKGDYISFLDADDYWEKDAYELFAKVIEQYEPDMLDCRLKYIYNGQAMPPQGHCHPKECLIGKEYIVKEVIPALTNLPAEADKFILDYTCNKIFRRSIIQENRICFDEQRRKWEDRPFVVQYISHCRTMYSLSAVCYNYVGVPGSLASSFDTEIFRSVVKNYKLYDLLFGNTYNYHSPTVYKIWFDKIHNVALDLIKNHYVGHEKKIREMFLECFSDETVLLWMSEWKPDDKIANCIIAHIQGKNFDALIHDYMILSEKKKRKEQLQQSFIVRTIKKVKRCIDR